MKGAGRCFKGVVPMGLHGGDRIFRPCGCENTTHAPKDQVFRDTDDMASRIYPMAEWTHFHPAAAVGCPQVVMAMSTAW